MFGTPDMPPNSICVFMAIQFEIKLFLFSSIYYNVDVFYIIFFTELNFLFVCALSIMISITYIHNYHPSENVINSFSHFFFLTSFRPPNPFLQVLIFYSYLVSLSSNQRQHTPAVNHKIQSRIWGKFSSVERPRASQLANWH